MDFKYKLIIFLKLLTIAGAALRFTNLQCESIDKSFATFQKCHLKVIQRGVVSLNVNLKLFQIPVTNATFNLSLHKKTNGYHLFLYNGTIDFCKFMKNRKLYPYMKVFIDSLLSVSNLNHTCPYDHDIIVDNMVLKESMIQYLPMPPGEYMIKLKAATYNKWRLDVKAYFTI